MTKEEIQKEIDSLQEEYNILESGDNEEEYDEMLDDCYNGVFNILPSRILKECDPIQYNCGLNDYNGNKMSELESELNDLKEDLKRCEE